MVRIPNFTVRNSRNGKKILLYKTQTNFIEYKRKTALQGICVPRYVLRYVRSSTNDIYVNHYKQIKKLAQTYAIIYIASWIPYHCSQDMQHFF